MASDDSEVFLLDDVDKAIIRELQIDGRIPFARLSPKVGLSQAAVRQRVKRLTERGVMQVVAVTDPLSLGLSTQAMVGIAVTGDVRTVAAAVAAL
ncbi:MAG: AsnC family transcriptional regulator, partial [Acidimicrobiaceae bacterium]|nr:AsnC family transcriptional regulator [Acidimicrobiaceae bacterium]